METVFVATTPAKTWSILLPQPLDPYNPANRHKEHVVDLHLLGVNAFDC